MVPASAWTALRAGSWMLTLIPRAFPVVHWGLRAHVRQSVARAKYFFMPVLRSSAAARSMCPDGQRQASSAST